MCGWLDVLREGVKRDGQCTYNVPLMRVRVTIVAVEKREMWVYVCIHVLVIRHAKRMRQYCIILRSVGCLATPYFYALCDKGHDLRGGGVEY